MMETRCAGPEDEPFLFELYASTRIEEISAWRWDQPQLQQFLQMQWMMQNNSYRLHFPDAEHFIISWDEVPAGRYMLNRTPEKLNLIDISLLPAFRRRGIGGQLIKQLQVRASLETQMIELHVMPHNPARKLYERLDFRLVEASDLYWKMRWHPHHFNH